MNRLTGITARLKQAATRRREGQHMWGASLRLMAGLAAAIVVGTCLLLLPGIGATRSLRLNEALFTAVSALCVTGLSIITPAKDLTLFGQVILVGLIQFGGIGFMAVAVVILRLLGRRVSLTDRITLRDSLDLPDLRSIIQVTKQVLLTVVAIEGIGALLLWWHWRGSWAMAVRSLRAFSTRCQPSATRGSTCLAARSRTTRSRTASPAR